MLLLLVWGSLTAMICRLHRRQAKSKTHRPTLQSQCAILPLATHCSSFFGNKYSLLFCFSFFFFCLVFNYTTFSFRIRFGALGIIFVTPNSPSRAQLTIADIAVILRQQFYRCHVPGYNVAWPQADLRQTTTNLLGVTQSTSIILLI